MKKVLYNHLTINIKYDIDKKIYVTKTESECLYPWKKKLLTKYRQKGYYHISKHGNKLELYYPNNDPLFKLIILKKVYWKSHYYYAKHSMLNHDTKLYSFLLDQYPDLKLNNY